MSNYDQLSQMLGIGPQKPRDSLCWGTVTAASGNELTVNVKGQTATAVKCCNAAPGDVVALECLGGNYRAIGRRGGEGVIPDMSVKFGTVTNSGSWTGTYVCRKMGNVVSFQFAAVHVTASATMGNTAFGQNQVATLPTGFRPMTNLYGICGGNATTRQAMVYIKTTGEVYLDYPNSTTAPTAGGFYGSITFMGN